MMMCQGYMNGADSKFYKSSVVVLKHSGCCHQGMLHRGEVAFKLSS